VGGAELAVRAAVVRAGRQVGQARCGLSETLADEVRLVAADCPRLAEREWSGIGCTAGQGGKRVGRTEEEEERAGSHLVGGDVLLAWDWHAWIGL